MNSFVYPKFNYGHLKWRFRTCKGIKKVEKVQERIIKLTLIDYEKTYSQLLDMFKKPSMEVKRL